MSKTNEEIVKEFFGVLRQDPEGIKLWLQLTLKAKDAEWQKRIKEALPLNEEIIERFEKQLKKSAPKLNKFEIANALNHLHDILTESSTTINLTKLL